MDNPPVYILLTTYKRQEMALKTIEGILDNLTWDNLGWVIVDDGSPKGYVDSLIEKIGEPNHLWTYNGNRRGVGHNMNVGLRHIWEVGGELTIMMEDDWYLDTKLDIAPYVKMLLNNSEHGLVRFGYVSPGLSAELISEEDKLFWKLVKRGFTYNYVGHPTIRHKRFHDVYGMFDEGLSPGQNELAMCGKVNAKEGPNLLIPVEAGSWGFFAHIGSESLADTEPNK